MARSKLSVLIESLFDDKGFKQADDAAQGAEKSTSKFNAGLTSTLGTIGDLTAAAAVMAGTFKQAFDLGRQGAQLEQLDISFNRVVEAAGPLPDILESVEARTQGTIDKATIQNAVLTLTAGATEEYSSALVAATPKLAEIATASTTLNPLLGDTATLMQNLGVAVKRQSPLIADNLGLTIKMENATKELAPELAGLADSYEDLTDQQKFLNEVLIQGDRLIEQAGDSVASQVDVYDRLATNVKNAKDETLLWLNEAVRPAAEFANGVIFQGYNTQIVEMTDNQIAAAESGADLLEIQEKLNEVYTSSGTGVFASGIEDASERTVRAAAAMSTSFEEFQNLYIELVGEDAQFAREYSPSIFEETTRAIYDTAQAERERQEATAAAAAAEAEANAALEERLALLESTGPTVQDVVAAYDDEARAASRAAIEERIAAEAAAEVEAAARAQAEALEAVAERQEILNDAYRQSGDIIEEVIAGNQTLAQSYQDVVEEQIIANIGLTESTAELFVQQGILSEQEATLRLEYSQTTLAITELTQSTVFQNRSITEQSEALDFLKNGMASTAEEAVALATAYDGTTNSLDAAKIGSDELRQKLVELDGETVGIDIDVSGLEQTEESSGVSLERLVALGETDATPSTDTSEVDTFSERTDEAQLKFDTLGDTIVEPVVIEESIVTASAEVDFLQEKFGVLDETVANPQVATGSISGAGDEVGSLQRQLDTLAGTYTVRVNIETSGSVPARPQGFALGGWTGETGGIVHPRELVVPENVIRQGAGAITEFADSRVPGGVPGGGGGDTFNFIYSPTGEARREDGVAMFNRIRSLAGVS